MLSHYEEKEEAIPIPKPEEAAFRNVTSIVQQPTPVIDERPTGYRGKEIETIAGMPQPARRIAAEHRREYGETPDLSLLRRDTSGLGKSEMMPMPMDPNTQRVLEAASLARIPESSEGAPFGRTPGTFQYADIMDKVLGPAPTPAVAPVTEGIPSEIAVPTSSGNAAVDLFRWSAYQARTKQRNEMISKTKDRALDTSRFETEQKFKEKKLASEETGRKSALDIKRRTAITAGKKEAEKLDPFIKRARDMALKKNPDFAYLPKEEQDTIILQEIERTQKLHKQPGPEEKKATRKKIGEKTYEKVNGQWMEV